MQPSLRPPHFLICLIQVVQAYVLLSTLETMRGNTEAGTRYLDHAHTMHNANAMGPDGKLRQDRPEQEEALDLVFQIYDQPKGSVVLMRTCNSSDLFPPSSSCHEGEDAVAASAAPAQLGERISSSASAVDQMIAQAMSPPSESQSGSLKALKYLGTACGLSAEVFDPTVKCVTVEQYLGEMDSALKVRPRINSGCLTAISSLVGFTATDTGTRSFIDRIVKLLLYDRVLRQPTLTHTLGGSGAKAWYNRDASY